MKIKDLILKTEKVNWQNLKDLQPIDLKNNYHSEKTKKSIIENGFARAIYVWQEQDNIYIIDGHLRTDILIELKNEGFEIPEQLNCTFLDLPNKKTAIKYLLQVFNQKTNPINSNNLDNWLQEVDLNIEELNIELEELHIELSEIEVEAEEAQEEVKEDEVPEVKHTFVVKGDLFELIDEEQGLNHRVLCGDSTMIDDVEKVMNGKKADMVFTDPPYNIDFKDTKKRRILNDDLGNKFESFINDVISNLLFCVEKGYIYLCFSQRFIHDYINPIINNNIKDYELIIWYKDTAMRLGKDYRNYYEPIWLFRINQPIFYGKREFEKNVWEIKSIHSAGSISDSGKSWFKGGSKELTLHPTQKPVKVPFTAIKNSSKKNNIILDFFIGSGSTLIACQQTKRKCYGIELDEHYCGVVITRWKNYMEKEGKKYSIKKNGEEFNLKTYEN